MLYHRLPCRIRSCCDARCDIDAVLNPYAAAETDAIVACSQQWLERAVIGLHLCPFAKAVHVKRQIRYAVTIASDADTLLLELEHELGILVQTPASEVDTTLLIHPRVMTAFIDYHFFLQEANALLRSLELDGVIQIASLHPLYEFSGSEPDDIENYTNRSPYPTLHLLREASIDRAVAAFPDAATIYTTNIATMQRLGHEAWRRLWLDEPASNG